MNAQGRAVVLLSGGQDSTTCLWWAASLFDVVAAVSFDYGQRHKVELECAARTAKLIGVDHITLDVPALKQLGQASLTNPDIGNVVAGEGRNTYADKRGLPPSFVPGRNLLFFTMGAAVAANYDAATLVVGVCQQDDAGYPDCRASFVSAMQHAIVTGFDWQGFQIEAPLLTRTKAETWQLAADLNVLGEIVMHTHTCYEGDRSDPPKPWGYGCGACGACTERKIGYYEFVDKRGARVPA